MIENFCFINKNKKIQKVKAESLEKINIPHIYCKTNPCILSLETKKENIPDVNCGNIDQSFYKECNGGKDGVFVVYNGNSIIKTNGKQFYINCVFIKWTNYEKIIDNIKIYKEYYNGFIHKVATKNKYKKDLFKDTNYNTHFINTLFTHSNNNVTNITTYNSLKQNNNVKKTSKYNKPLKNTINTKPVEYKKNYYQSLQNYYKYYIFETFNLNKSIANYTSLNI